MAEKKKTHGKSHNVRRKLQQFEDRGINKLGIEPFNHFIKSAFMETDLH